MKETWAHGASRWRRAAAVALGACLVGWLAAPAAALEAHGDGSGFVLGEEAAPTEAEPAVATGPWTYDVAWNLEARQPPPTSTPRTPLLRRQRPNTVSLGMQGSYGVVRGTSRLADGFDDGPGYAFRFRYMLSPSFALGFSFENQRFNDRGGEPSTEPGASDSVIVMTAVSVEGVVFLNRETDVTPYFLGGFGHASPDIVDEVLGSARVNEGIYLVLGAGLERFIRSRFSLDFTLRGYALVSNSEFTSFAQICGGIHLYPGD